MSLRSELLSGGSMQTWGHFDLDSGDLTIEYRQDVQPLLDRNKALANDGDGYSPDREFRRVGSIPNSVYMQHFVRGIDLMDPNNDKYVKRLFNDIDYLNLRTAPGRV